MTDEHVAQQLLYLALGQPRGFHYLERTMGGQHCKTFIRTSGWLEWFQRACVADDCVVSAVPHRDRTYQTGLFAGALWVPIESGRSAETLRFFKPRPSLVLQAGGTVRQWALWALERPLGETWAVRLNRRIAHHLGAPKKLCGMSAMIPTPGSVIRHDRPNAPLLVRVVELHEEFHSPRAVAGRLPEAPDPDAWREW